MSDSGIRQPECILRRIGAVAAITLIATLLMHGSNGLTSNAALAAGGGPEMALTVREGGICNGNDCYVRANESFHLSVDVVTPPAQDYILFQTYIDFGGTFDWNASEDGAGPGTCIDGIDNGELDGRDYDDPDCTAVPIAYVPTASVGDEITWPDALPVLEVRTPYVHSKVTHGAVSGFNPPVLSSYAGEVLNLEFSCPANAAETTMTLFPYGAPFVGTYGAQFATVAEIGDITPIYYTPKTNALTVHCIEPTAGDYDGDGCSDAAENGTDPALGGDRNFINPWDFYDVAGPGGPDVPDGVIDLANDYMQVLAHYSPTGYPAGQGYEHYDRGPWLGSSSWKDVQPPDGVIDLPNDLLGLIQQIGHSCA